MIVDTDFQKYLDTLLQYYEEEVSGEAYFHGLSKHFDQKDKLMLLAKVEQHVAKEVEPLLAKYALIPRSKEILIEEGINYVSRHANLDWIEFVKHVVVRYPNYLDDFAALEKMAPNEDLQLLQQLTAHEIAAIEFAELELANDPDSCAPLYQYLSS